MKTVYVFLPNVERVQSFVETLELLDGDFELLFEDYIIEAKSIMGILSLDLSKPVKLKIFNDSEQNLKAVTPFLAPEGDEL